MNVTKNTKSSSIIVQWDAVDDFLPTTYTVIWTNNKDHFGVAVVEEQTSYTITGLTLDTVYTITVAAANMCGQGPEFRTIVSFSTDTTSKTSTISPTVTASTNPMTIISTSNTTSINIPSITAIINTTTNSMNTMYTVVSKDIGTIANTTNLETSMTITNLDIIITTATITTVITTLGTTTTTTTDVATVLFSSSATITSHTSAPTSVMSTKSTVNPANATTVDETSKISTTANMIMNIM